MNAARNAPAVLFTLAALIVFAACGDATPTPPPAPTDTPQVEQPAPTATATAPAADPAPTRGPTASPLPTGDPPTAAAQGAASQTRTAPPTPTDLPATPAPFSRSTGEVDSVRFIVGTGSEATFSDLTPLPDGFADGDTATADVTGTLRINGMDVPLTFAVEARDDGDVVYVVGRSSFTWDDIGEPVPTARSVVSVGDEVRVEVLLALTPTPG